MFFGEAVDEIHTVDPEPAEAADGGGGGGLRGGEVQQDGGVGDAERDVGEGAGGEESGHGEGEGALAAGEAGFVEVPAVLVGDALADHAAVEEDVERDFFLRGVDDGDPAVDGGGVEAVYVAAEFDEVGDVHRGFLNFQ